MGLAFVACHISVQETRVTDGGIEATEVRCSGVTRYSQVGQQKEKEKNNTTARYCRMHVSFWSRIHSFPVHELSRVVCASVYENGQWSCEAGPQGGASELR